MPLLWTSRAAYITAFDMGDKPTRDIAMKDPWVSTVIRGLRIMVLYGYSILYGAACSFRLAVWLTLLIVQDTAARAPSLYGRRF